MPYKSNLGNQYPPISLPQEHRPNYDHSSAPQPMNSFVFPSEGGASQPPKGTSPSLDLFDIFSSSPLDNNQVLSGSNGMNTNSSTRFVTQTYLFLCFAVVFN